MCLDPQHLNAAIKRENYVLPTTEEVVTHLHEVTVDLSQFDGRTYW